MHPFTKHDNFFENLSDWFSVFLRVILNILLVIAMVALAIGIVKSGIDLFHNVRKPLETILQEVLLDVVFILALTELVITILGYLKDGHVHVRYIVDTVLIIMLNEVVSVWFKHPSLQEAIGISVVIATLAAVRFSVSRLSAEKD